MSNRQYAKQGTHVLELDGTIHWGGERSGRVVLNGSQQFTFDPNLGGGDCDYPIQDNVKDGVVYGDGLFTGTLGQINTDNLDIQSLVQNNVKSLISEILPDYEEMRYQNEPTKNDFYSNALQYAVLIEDSFHTDQLISAETVGFTVRIKLSNDFVDNDDDLAAREAAKALITAYETIRRKIRATRAGTYNKSINDIDDWNREDPNYIDENNIVIVEATFTVGYKVKNC